MDLLTFRFLSKGPIRLVYVGIPGILFLAGVFVLFYVLAPSLSIRDAENRVRLCLQRELSQRHADLLKQTGKRLPDSETAAQWAREIRRVRGLSFHSIGIRRPFPDVFLGFDTPAWVVRVVFLEGDRKQEPRYFWLSWDGIDGETSKWVWYVSV